MFVPDEDLVKDVNNLQKEMHDQALKGETSAIVDFDLLSQMISCVFSCIGTNAQIEINRSRLVEELATVVEAMAGKKTKEFAMEVAGKIRKVQ